MILEVDKNICHSGCTGALDAWKKCVHACAQLRRGNLNIADGKLCRFLVDLSSVHVQRLLEWYAVLDEIGQKGFVSNKTNFMLKAVF